MARKKKILYIQKGNYPSNTVRAGLFAPLYSKYGFTVRYFDLEGDACIRALRKITPPILKNTVERIIKGYNAARQYWWLHFRLKHFDGIVLMRYFSYSQVALIRRLTTARLLYDVDDAIWQPYYCLNGDDIFKIFATVDMVSVDNEYLFRVATRYNSQVFILPPFAQYENLAMSHSRKSDEVILGWIGSASTIYQLYMLHDVLEALGACYKNIKLMVLGASSMPLPFFEKITVFGIAEYSAAEMNEARARIDIGLFPVFSGENALGRGVGKPVIYMGAAIPVVASKFAPAEALIRDGENGCLAATAAEWREKLSRLIEDRALREKIGRAGFESVREKYSLEHNFKIMRNNFLSKL